MELSLEEVKTLYFKNDSLIEPPYKLMRLDASSSRYYCEEINDKINFYPSWTTMIQKMMPSNPFLNQWYTKFNSWEEVQSEMERAAFRGTFLHEQIANILINGNYCFDEQVIRGYIFEFINRQFNKNILLHFSNYQTAIEFIYKDIRKDILSYLQFYEERKVEPLAIEIPLRSLEMGFAGTIDFIGYLTFNRTRILALGDIKSGKKGFYPSHEEQLHCYKRMWEENFPEHPIEMVFNWAPKDWETKPTYNFENQNESNYKDVVDLDIAKYKILHKIKPSNYVEIKGDYKVGDDIANNYNVIDLEKHIKKLLGDKKNEPNIDDREDSEELPF